MKAVGIGCFWFASRGILKDLRAFNATDYFVQVKRALETVDNLSNVDIYSEFTTFRIYHDNPGTFAPMCAGAKISFDIFLPERVQESHGHLGSAGTGVENFHVVISYSYELPVTYIYYDLPKREPNRSEGAFYADPSYSVMIVREYLTAKLADNKQIQFCCLGPSPFPADIAIQHSVDRDQRSHITVLDHDRENRCLVVTVTNDGSRSDIDDFVQEFSRILGCFYYIVRMRNQFMRLEQGLLNRTMELCERHGGIWFGLKNRLQRRRRIDEAFSGVLEYKSRAIEIESYISSRKRAGILDEKNALYHKMEMTTQLMEAGAIPLTEVLDVLKISEERRQKFIGNMTTVVAGLIGGVVGAALTFLLTVPGGTPGTGH